MGYQAAPEGWWESSVRADPPRTAKAGILRVRRDKVVAKVGVAG